jgi:prevent-host-death family protein
MISVGVRELRQRASELLRRVQRGETIEITDRGRPVARLAPLPEGSPLDVLKSAGEVDSATSEFDDLPDPLESRAPMLPSSILDRLRSNER